MKGIISTSAAAILFSLLMSTFIFAQAITTTVEDILSNPGKYESEEVDVEGTVTIYVKESTTTTRHYMLRGHYGAIIKVNSSQGEPEINTLYKVVGIVYIDPTVHTPFISEKSRVSLEEPVVPTTVIEKKGPATWLYLLILVLAAALVYLIYYQTKQKKVAKEEGVKEEKAAAVEKEERKTDEEPKTIQWKAPPKTMKFIPGELTIVSGEDAGKSFKIAGYPTGEGSIVTIGRKEVTGDREYAHIKISDSIKTVSRMQARLVHKEGKLFLENLSDTNPTQLNGEEIAQNSQVEVKPNDIIRMGSIEMKYSI